MSFSAASSLSSRRRCSSGGSLSSSGSSPETVSPLSFELSLQDESESDITETECTTDFKPIPVLQSHKQHEKQQHHCVEAPAFRYGEEAYDCNYVFANDTPIKKPSARTIAGARKSNFNFMTCMSLCGLFILAMCFLGSRSADHTSAAQLKEAEAARNELVKTQERLLLQLAKDRRLPQENTDVLQHVTLLQEELEHTTAELKEEQTRREEVEREAEEAWAHYDEATSQLSDVEMQMQEDMAKMYLTLANDQFGPGPHYAEFEVSIWQNDKAETRYFTVETTPIEHMPASVFVFLQQVHNGLWDDSSFHINAPHVLLAQPLSAHDVDEQPFTKMERMGLARVPFEEYNEDYTHTAYTLGYGGAKLPGPNFYINKVDNTNHHEGEPCFAKVIIGYDTIDLIGQFTGPADNPYYIQPVDIVSVRLVSDLAEAHGGQDYLNFIDGHDEH